MPDWKRFVRRRMHSLCCMTKEGVVAELAHHLEETYDQARSSGLAERAAIRLTLQEGQSWNVLAAEIDHAKQEGAMNHRTKSLWIPGLATLFGASVLLMGVQFSGFNPHLTWVRGLGMLFYWPWLVGLPMFGAVGAYLSRRAHGSVCSRFVAGLAPALVMLIVMALILPFGLVIDGLHFFILVAFGLGILNWVVLPAVALLLGVLPFVGALRVSGIEEGEDCAG